MLGDIKMNGLSIVQKKGTIVWLEDDPLQDWVRVRREELESKGFQVHVESGFAALSRELQRRSDYASDVSNPNRVSVLLLDIMVEGVDNLTPYFPWVLNAQTARGYAAGLVFLERVLSPEIRSSADRIFGHFDMVPVIVNSIREIGPDELLRIKEIRGRRKGKIEILVKAYDGRFVRVVEDAVL